MVIELDGLIYDVGDRVSITKYYENIYSCISGEIYRLIRIPDKGDLFSPLKTIGGLIINGVTYNYMYTIYNLIDIKLLSPTGNEDSISFTHTINDWVGDMIETDTDIESIVVGRFKLSKLMRVYDDNRYCAINGLVPNHVDLNNKTISFQLENIDFKK
jgi:hypothetical protein